MGRCKPSRAVKIVTGFISNDIEIFKKASGLIIKKFGPADSASLVFPFNCTHYYDDEMGEGLEKRFLSFEKLISPENIYNLKIFTNGLEQRFLQSGKRKINIDPGYITLSKLILLTTKDYSHRIYLKKGVYAETTLIFKEGSYGPREWTYPDYKTAGYIDYFNKVRRTYQSSLKSKGL